MNKTFWITAIAVYVVSMAFGIAGHGGWLAGDYAQLKDVFRPPAEQGDYLIWLIIAHVVFALAFVWIYRKGRESTPYLAQGLRYGVAMALLVSVPMYLIYYSVQPMPGMVVVKQIVVDTLMMLVAGVVTAWMYRNA